jgi:amidase
VDDALWLLDATAQADLVRSRSVSAVEMVEAALARAEETAELHAVTMLFADRALSRAEQATGPFAGVPILLKDAGQELTGTPMWMGSTVLKRAGYTSTVTTELASQLEAVGFVVIGKAAVPELMIGITTEPPIGPPAGNPWAPERTVGGTSGGSAAAVASGIVAIAHGSDSTGSLRFPAHCCGVVTLKPSAGRISSRLPGGITNPGNTHADFVLARSARDLAASFTSLARPTRVDVNPIKRVGLLDAMPFGLTIESETEQALRDVASDLAEIGIEIEVISADFLEDYGKVVSEAAPTISDSRRAAVVDWIENEINRPVTAEDLSPSVFEAAERGRRLNPETVADAHAVVLEAARAAASWTARADALLLPILSGGPWPNGTPGPDGLLGGVMCSFANFSGQPSIAVPTVHDGLPLGIQLQGSQGHDEALIDVLNSIRPLAPLSPYMVPPNGAERAR